MIRGLMLCGLMLMSASTPFANAKVQSAWPGKMTIEDTGAFSEEGQSKAKGLFEDTKFRAETQLTVVVLSRIPDRVRGEYARVKDNANDRNRFVGEWANQEYKDRNLNGVFVLISKEGGIVRVLADRNADAGRGFDDAKMRELRDIFRNGFKAATDVEGEAATQLRDQTLLKATQYVIDELKDKIVSTDNNRVTSNSEGEQNTGRSVMGWVCIGLCVVVVVWVIIGLFRAMSGAGGGYGGGGMGGGGFFPSLMGGMFGAMAGMYLYDQFSGHDSSSSDMASDNMGDDGYNDGAGDIDGGGDSGGYDDGGGDFGGGDWGGGGDDFGGGDFGGGDW